MAFTISTNLAATITQTNLDKAAVTLNSAVEKMSTGYKVNSDNSAYSINENWETQLGSLDIAADNAVYGADLLATLKDSYAAVADNLKQVKDLSEQAENKEIDEKGIEKIKAEITSRLEEIDNVSKNCKFDEKNLMDGSIKSDIDLQISVAGNSTQIVLNKELFEKNDNEELFEGVEIGKLAEIFTNPKPIEDTETEDQELSLLDRAINKVAERTINIEDAQNKIDALIESIEVQSENITSSLSPINDAETSRFIQSEIFQKPKETLLSTANQNHNSVINLL